MEYGLPSKLDYALTWLFIGYLIGAYSILITPEMLKKFWRDLFGGSKRKEKQC